MTTAMNFTNELIALDQQLAQTKLEDFIPAEIFDIHVHPYRADFFAPNVWPHLKSQPLLGAARHRATLSRYMPSKTIHALGFGLPHKTADRPAQNAWLHE